MGTFMHPCEGDMVCARVPSQAKIPYFNAPIYLEDKTQIGKVDEILGPMTELFFTVKLQPGVLATSFKPNDKVYIATDKLLPLERFLTKPKAPGGKVEKPLGQQGMRGKSTPRGRGGFAPRGRGGFAARGRGGFTPRGRGGFTPRGRGRGRG